MYMNDDMSMAIEKGLELMKNKSKKKGKATHSY